jgi:hypothetical protein
MQPVNISDLGRSLLAQTDVREAADPRVFASIPDISAMLGCKDRRTRQLMDEGALDSVLEGGSRRGTIASVYRLIRKRIAASHPAGQAPVKAHDGRALRKRQITKTEGSKGGASRSRRALTPQEARGGPANAG